MKVSFIAAVKNGAERLEGFLDSISAQTRPPDEIVLVDGGSTDGSWQIVRQRSEILALRDPHANRARARNIAVNAASHDVLAVSDAHCILAPDWLERIIEPIERGADVSMGFYKPIARSFLQQCAAAVSVKEREEIRPGWISTARSMAFRRDVFDSAGGYPEWLEIGEDMYLSREWVRLGFRIDLALDAVVYWPVRSSLAATWQQYFNYAQGDALARMYSQRHLIRFVSYSLVAAAATTRRRSLVALVVSAGGVYASLPLRRAWHRLPNPRQRLGAVVGVPAMMAFIDAAKMSGYVKGLIRKASGFDPHPEP